MKFRVNCCDTTSFERFVVETCCKTLLAKEVVTQTIIKSKI